MSLRAGARDARPVGGGDINEAWRVTLVDGRAAFVKTRADAAPGEYAAEATGLRWLAAPGALRTPRVLEVGADYLALEWIEHGRLDGAGAEELGRGLATTHAAGASGFGDPVRPDEDRGSAPASLALSAKPAAPRRRHGGPRALARWRSPTMWRRTGRRSTPSGACARWRGSRANARLSARAVRARWSASASAWTS